MFIKHANSKITQVFNNINEFRGFVKRSGKSSETTLFTRIANKLKEIELPDDLENYIILRNRAISSMELWGANQNFDAFPDKELRTKFATFKNCRIDVDHICEDDERDIIGIVLDSVYVEPKVYRRGRFIEFDEHNIETGDQVTGGYIENLWAIHKGRAEAHTAGLVSAILNGEVTDSSMGAMVAIAECSICGKQYSDTRDVCTKHIGVSYFEPEVDDRGHQIYRTDENGHKLTDKTGNWIKEGEWLIDYSGKKGQQHTFKGKTSIAHEINHDIEFFEDSVIKSVKFAEMSGSKAKAGGEGADNRAKILEHIPTDGFRETKKKSLLDMIKKVSINESLLKDEYMKLGEEPQDITEAKEELQNESVKKLDEGESDKIMTNYSKYEDLVEGNSWDSFKKLVIEKSGINPRTSQLIELKNFYKKALNEKVVFKIKEMRNHRMQDKEITDKLLEMGFERKDITEGLHYDKHFGVGEVVNSMKKHLLEGISLYHKAIIDVPNMNSTMMSDRMDTQHHVDDTDIGQKPIDKDSTNAENNSLGYGKTGERDSQLYIKVNELEKVKDDLLDKVKNVDEEDGKVVYNDEELNKKTEQFKHMADKKDKNSLNNGRGIDRYDGKYNDKEQDLSQKKVNVEDYKDLKEKDKEHSTSDTGAVQKDIKNPKKTTDNRIGDSTTDFKESVDGSSSTYPNPYKENLKEHEMIWKVEKLEDINLLITASINEEADNKLEEHDEHRKEFGFENAKDLQKSQEKNNNSDSEGNLSDELDKEYIDTHTDRKKTADFGHLEHKGTYKVVACSDNTNSFGLYQMVVIDQSGDAWKIHGNDLHKKNKGEVLTVPVNNNNIPKWSNMGYEIPEHIETAPQNIIDEVWGSTKTAKIATIADYFNQNKVSDDETASGNHINANGIPNDKQISNNIINATKLQKYADDWSPETNYKQKAEDDWNMGLKPNDDFKVKREPNDGIIKEEEGGSDLMHPIAKKSANDYEIINDKEEDKERAETTPSEEGMIEPTEEADGYQMDGDEITDIPKNIESDIQQKETDLINSLTKQKWVIITATKEALAEGGEFADKPGLMPENLERNEQLKGDIEQLGYTPIEVKGVYKKTYQGDSYLVYDIKLRDAFELGVKYGQESILIPEGLLYCEGTSGKEVSGYNLQQATLEPVKINPNTGHFDYTIGDDAENEDFYSTFKIGDNMVSLALGLNYGKYIPYWEFPNYVRESLEAKQENQEAEEEHTKLDTAEQDSTDLLDIDLNSDNLSLDDTDSENESTVDDLSTDAPNFDDIKETDINFDDEPEDKKQSRSKKIVGGTLPTNPQDFAGYVGKTVERRNPDTGALEGTDTIQDLKTIKNDDGTEDVGVITNNNQLETTKDNLMETTSVLQELMAINFEDEDLDIEKKTAGIDELSFNISLDDDERFTTTAEAESAMGGEGFFDTVSVEDTDKSKGETKPMHEKKKTGSLGKVNPHADRTKLSKDSFGIDDNFFDD